MKEEAQELSEEVVFSGTKYAVADRLQAIFWETERPASRVSIPDDSGSLRITEEAFEYSSQRTPAARVEDLSDALPRKQTRQPRSPSSTEVVPESGRQSLWNICLTARFSKSASRLDKKLQGRVLEALLELGDAPDTPHGDTIKPLEGDRRGEWRYRIGDYRLIYRPDRNRREILLLEVAPRGGAYA